MTRRLTHFGLAIFLAMGSLSPTLAVAHGGADDEAPSAAIAGPASPRTEAISNLFELVASAKGDQLVITIDRFATNEPVTGAEIVVGEGDGSSKADALADGTYVIRAPWVAQPGRHDLTFTITAGETSDLLAATLDVPKLIAPPVQVSPVAGALADRRTMMIAALAFLLGMLTIVGLRLRGRRRAAALTVMLLLGLFTIGLVTAGSAFAHGAEDSPTPAASDNPRRLPDGSVAVPKIAQRLLAIRTVQVARTRSPRTVQVIGEVIPDPSAAGKVQGIQSGRVEAPAGGALAHVGQTVRKGEALATIVPAITGVERGGLQAQVAELDTQIRIAQQKVTRLASLVGSVAGREVDDARAELAGARARRAAVSPTLVQGEVLRAPVDGVVSVSNAMVGQVVESRDVLFEIVDPARLWVEALAFEPSIAAEMTGASARTTGGASLHMTFVGRSLTLRQGAMPLEFRLEHPPSGLTIGEPVTVIVALAASESGFALPRTAVVRLPNGGAAVWDHVSAERFVPRPVRLQPLDGGNVLVLAGLKPDERIVVQGGDLLNQVR